MGRTGKAGEWITPEGLKQIGEWAKSGMIDEDIAKNMGIALTTFYRWKNRYRQLEDALKENKAAVDKEVENALFKSCTGYYVEETVTENRNVIKTTKKWIKPDTAAQIFWMKNRRPSEWRDKIVQEVESDKDLNIVLIPAHKPTPPPDDITDRDEIIEYYEKAMREAAATTFEEYGD